MLHQHRSESLEDWNVRPPLLDVSGDWHHGETKIRQILAKLG